ncbi:MAG: hypothetical protein R3185_03510 [Candidatus Thermoplasmatota archaeon]|nr:hypothetical protein [Candidatus Thermoplasmatota archaeon]
MRPAGWHVTLIACLLLAGCTGLEQPAPAETGIACALYDPAVPAATAQLVFVSEHERPANESFVLEVHRVVDGEREEEPFQRIAFPESGCVGAGIPGPGTYFFWAQAPDPSDDLCSWFDGEEVTVGADDVVRVELEVQLACA